MARYVVEPPVPEMYAYYRVIDTQSPVMPNFGVAEFYDMMPYAKLEADGLAARLNGAIVPDVLGTPVENP